jgi:NAD-dependent deacetylase
MPSLPLPLRSSGSGRIGTEVVRKFSSDHTKTLMDFTIKAGNRRAWEMHGSLNHCYCTNCEAGYSLREINLSEDLPGCPACRGLLRPDICLVWRSSYFLPEIEEALKVCEIFLVVGNSGAVYPAAGFVMSANLWELKPLP